MKYIKTYEKLIKKSDPRIINHPLFDLSQIIKNILKNISILDEHFWINKKSYIPKISRYFHDDGKITIEYHRTFSHYDCALIETEKSIIFENHYHDIFKGDVNKNSNDFFNFIDKKFKKFNILENENKNQYKFNMSDIKYIENIFNDYNESLKKQIITDKYNL